MNHTLMHKDDINTKEAILTPDDVMSYHNFIFALCTFVDEFKRSKQPERMIESPPQNPNKQEP